MGGSNQFSSIIQFKKIFVNTPYNQPTFMYSINEFSILQKLSKHLKVHIEYQIILYLQKIFDNKLKKKKNWVKRTKPELKQHLAICLLEM